MKEPLLSKEAKEAHKSIRGFMIENRPNPFPQVRKGIIIRGYFRTDSYEWTVFKFYINKDNLYVFQHRDNVQHEGECIRYLENDNIIVIDK